MPPLVPGGKLDPSLAGLGSGLTKDLELHHKRLREDEERIRDELRAKEDKLRKSLRMWDRLEREAKGHVLRTELSDKSLQAVAGDGAGGAAF